MLRVGPFPGDFDGIDTGDLAEVDLQPFASALILAARPARLRVPVDGILREIVLAVDGRRGGGPGVFGGDGRLRQPQQKEPE